ncbi:MAG: glycosyltransferase family 2 protein [Nitrospira sp.]|nr:glycosyltransferase family 2 protein [Nitrospira sp.]MDR4468517.1 glycosyltransferase family 2 protein [Nitrospira sp.]MDR4470880.1 glycosyltransferase family 2 protein [Nitrospira sp.]
MSLSILILTLNEERNLAECLKSVEESDDIVVFDSFSNDQTVKIAEEMGARVVQRRFDNYAAQRNAGLNEVPYKHPWVLMVDADERVTPELWAEMRSATETADQTVSLFHMRRKDYWFGRWLRRSSGYPTWFGRLVRVGHVTVQREINEQYVAHGEAGFLNEHLLHYPFNKGVTYWLERHNRYSTMEAAGLVMEQRERIAIQEMWSGNPIVRRKAMKQVAYRLPGRPFWVFIYLYMVRGGCLDGRAGLRYCMLRTMYEYMIDLKVKERLEEPDGQRAGKKNSLRQSLLPSRSFGDEPAP